jgi:serine/threonine protein kinase/Flp pilus assembly protein TadD
MATNGAASVPPLSTLADRLAEELGQRWHAGERPVVEDYLALYPELCDEPDAAIELIYEELCLRREFGHEAAAADVLRRFPQWREPLLVMIECLRLLEAGPASPRFPAAGECLGEFRLLAELGRGAQGRVFLATQAALADRPVVLKLVPRSGQEHLSLARLQHTHIVPLYSVQDDPARNLRALCMPYFGGATLARLLELLHGHPPGQRAGRDLLEALGRAQAAGPISVPVEGPACRFLARASYVRAVCWMGTCLAEALQYSHERGLIHLDLKPSNVLWGADGQPMLLDLHLTRGPIPAGAPAPAWLGGTPAYMAPEQRLALAAVREGRSVREAVDGRADLYALGMMLCEALGGDLPPPGRAAAAWLRRRNPQVSVGLADILGKCLADDPRARYRDASALADDLRRHMADLPLRGVANRSLTERWRRWRRRRPYGLVLPGLVMAVLAGAGLALAYVSHEAHKAREALAEGREHLQGRAYGAAHAAWRRGLAAAENLPFHGELTEELLGQLRLAERAEAAQELHLFVERVRALYGADGQPAAELRAVERHCRAFWQRRDQIARHLGAQPVPEREQVQTDLLDLAILWTDLRVRLAGKSEINAVRQEALEVLAQAEALFGPSCVLDGERRVHTAALRLPGVESGAAPTPRTAWEHYALGRAYFRSGELEAAAAQFDRALALQPQAFWPNFHKGKCAYQRALYEDAVLAFTACAVLAPQSAWCVYNRGLTYDALGQSDRALNDYDRALQLDPGLAMAAVNRGMLHYRARRYTSALDDLRRALDSGADPALVYYDRALVHLAKEDRDAALASLRKALEHDPGHEQALQLSASLRPKR